MDQGAFWAKVEPEKEMVLAALFRQTPYPPLKLKVLSAMVFTPLDESKRTPQLKDWVTSVWSRVNVPAPSLRRLP